MLNKVFLGLGRIKGNALDRLHMGILSRIDSKELSKTHPTAPFDPQERISA